MPAPANYDGDHESLPGEKVELSMQFWETVSGEFPVTVAPWDYKTSCDLRDNETNLI